MSSGEVLSSLRGKVLELPDRKTSRVSDVKNNLKMINVFIFDVQGVDEQEEWTPFNGEMHMNGIKVY